MQAQPSVTLHPSVITDCDPYALGLTTVQWSDPGGQGLVQVLVGSVQASFTGHVPPSGTSTTGVWVNDGMPFVLVDAAGNTLASTVAHVLCSPQGGPVAAGLATESFLPLDIGNRWVYRTLTRFSTPTYAQWLVTGSEEIGGQLWFVIQVSASDMQSNSSNSQMLMRQDPNGAIYIYQNGAAALWLDPNKATGETPQMVITGSGPFQNSLGAFAEAANYVKQQGLIQENGTLVQGIGLMSSSSTMLTGSSGGFTASMDLVEARIDGHIVFGPPAASVQVTAEASLFDVTNERVTNCILPCYFAACGIGLPQPDPPGTYKPCFRAGVKLSALAGPTPVVLSILDGGGNVLTQSSLSLLPDDGGGSTGFHEMPLYLVPNQPFAPGSYQLRAESPVGSATVAFQIE